jgi:peptidyl-prolyl cis-trans isomerase SurA
MTRHNLILMLWRLSLIFAVLVLPPVQAQLKFGPGDEAPGSQLDGIVAIVDDDIITRSELDAAVSLAKRRGNQGDMPPEDVLEQQVLEGVIMKKLELRAAEREGIVIDDNTLNEAIESIAQQNNVTLTQMRQTIEGEGFNFAEFREQIRGELTATRLRQRVVDSGVQISDQEVNNALSSEPAQGSVQQTETRARHILITPNELISEEEAQLRLARLRERIQGGDDFGEIARANSNDTGSAVQGGELGWVQPGQTVPQFEAQMNKLDVGETSQPFKSAYGWHIVQVMERRQGVGSDEVQRNQAREALYKRRVEEEWEQWLRRLREEAYVEIRL